jgi:3-deoxy-D-manno-octulosonic-acid transferase
LRITITGTIYIAGTMGEILILIGPAGIGFLEGQEKVSDQNLLGLTALIKPSLAGPSFYNFQLITKQLSHIPCD